MQMTTITKSKSVSFSFLSRPTDPVLLLIFYLQQEIKVEWPNFFEMAIGDFSLNSELFLHTAKNQLFFG